MATKRKQEPREDEGSPYLAWDCSHNIHMNGAKPTLEQKRINLQWRRHKQRVLTRNTLAACIRAARFIPRPAPVLVESVKKARKPAVKKAKPEGDGMKLVKKVRAKQSGVVA